jgi:hypothetical protein
MQHSTSRNDRRVLAGFAVILLVAGVTVAGQLNASPARAAGAPIFDSIPVGYDGTDPSLGFGATGTAELGQHVQFAGTDRHLETVTVGLTSWACETGVWNQGCLTVTPNGSFALPITVNVYAALPDSDVDGTLPGAVLATLTQSVDVPYRPTSDPVNCVGEQAGWYFDAASSSCLPALAFTATYDFALQGVVLPDDAIVAVAFDSAALPGKSDALNASLRLTPTETGTDPDPDNLFWNTSVAAYYTDNGAGGVGILRSDSDWASTGLLVLQVDASTPAAAPAAVLPDTGAPSPLVPVGGAALVLFLLGGLLLAARHRAIRD